MSFPNPWDDPDYFRNVVIGGRPVLASLVAIDGNEISAEWTAQKPTGNSGATNVFKGMNPAGPGKLTFEICGDTPEQLRAEWNDLRDFYEMFQPVPGLGGNGTGNTTGSKGSAAYGQQWTNGTSAASSAVSTSPEDLLKQAQQALAAVQSGANTATTPGASASAAGTSTTANAAALPNPGPRPPTLSLKNGYFNYVGITSISMSKWKGPYPTATLSMRVDIDVVTQKDPVPAAVGAASPKAKDNPGQKTIAFGDVQGPAAQAAAANALLAGGAAE